MGRLRNQNRVSSWPHYHSVNRSNFGCLTKRGGIIISFPNSFIPWQKNNIRRIRWPNWERSTIWVTVPNLTAFFDDGFPKQILKFIFLKCPICLPVLVYMSCKFYIVVNVHVRNLLKFTNLAESVKSDIILMLG